MLCPVLSLLFLVNRRVSLSDRLHISWCRSFPAISELQSRHWWLRLTSDVWGIGFDRTRLHEVFELGFWLGSLIIGSRVIFFRLD